MATVVGKTSAASGVGTPHASTASGDVLVASMWSDAIGTPITAPDGTWTQVEQLQDSAPANRLSMFYKVLSGAPDATYTFGGPTIGANTMVTLRPGAGETLDSVVSALPASAITGTPAVLASTAIDTTPTPNVVIGSWCADDASTVTSAPATLADGEVVLAGSGSLATYNAVDVNDAAFSDSLTWSTNGTERIAIVAAFKFTAAPSADPYITLTFTPLP